MSEPFVAIDHVQLAMPAGRVDDARAFYGTLLGMREIPKPAELAARGGAWFGSGTVQLHVGVDPQFIAATKAHPGLRCSNFTELVARLRASNVDVRPGEPTSDGCARAFVADPFGNRIELIEVRS